ncbi:MAG: DoxX family protein [Acidobacteriota bacterium]
MARFIPNSLSRYALSVMRIVAGFTFTLHGAQKILGAFGGLDGHGAKAAMLSLPWFGGILELSLGPLILLGVFTRPVAFILAGEMAVAYFKVHAPRGFFPILNGGELAVLYCFLFLFLSATGAGPISLDRIRHKS